MEWIKEISFKQLAEDMDNACIDSMDYKDKE